MYNLPLSERIWKSIVIGLIPAFCITLVYALVTQYHQIFYLIYIFQGLTLWLISSICMFCCFFYSKDVPLSSPRLIKSLFIGACVSLGFAGTIALMNTLIPSSASFLSFDVLNVPAFLVIWLVTAGTYFHKK